MNRNDATQLLDEARRLGFEVRRNGDRLHVEGPREAEWFIAKLAEAKPQLLDALATTESERVHCIVLLGQPDPGDDDNDDLAVGQRIVEAVRKAGGRLTVENGKIALRWTGDMPEAGGLIDRIRATRIGVVGALKPKP